MGVEILDGDVTVPFTCTFKGVQQDGVGKGEVVFHRIELKLAPLGDKPNEGRIYIEDRDPRWGLVSARPNAILFEVEVEVEAGGCGGGRKCLEQFAVGWLQTLNHCKREYVYEHKTTHKQRVRYASFKKMPARDSQIKKGGAPWYLLDKPREFDNNGKPIEALKRVDTAFHEDLSCRPFRLSAGPDPIVVALYDTPRDPVSYYKPSPEADNVAGKKGTDPDWPLVEIIWEHTFHSVIAVQHIPSNTWRHIYHLVWKADAVFHISMAQGQVKPRSVKVVVGPLGTGDGGLKILRSAATVFDGHSDLYR
jgi:hypothetical protein